ncbi:hypothetical protein [Parafrankia discariae]|uniref:hypothetical protein n=1 Tax=Parafrankia discariae TaxID=365528 RepID=UPI000360BA2C|nr:hypothetical protein [Parafrankia discariae]
MSNFSDSRVDAQLNADGTFTLTVHPTAPRDAILAGLLTIPAATTFTGTPTTPHTPAVLLLTPPDADATPTGGWIPRTPPANGTDAFAKSDPVRTALTTLLAAAVLDLPGFARRPEVQALHDALGRLLPCPPDDAGPWRSPHTR